MNENVKRVLSVLLAFVMVFAAGIPALADDSPIEGEEINEPVDPIGQPSPTPFTIEVTQDINDVKFFAEEPVMVHKAEAGKEDQWEYVNTVDVEQGEGRLVIELEPNKDYRVSVPAGEVLPNTTYEYFFSTDDKGNVIPTPGREFNGTNGVLDPFHFDLFYEDEPSDGVFSILSVDANGNYAPNVDFNVYTALKSTNDDGKEVYVFNDKTYVKDQLIDSFTTNEFGRLTWNQGEVDQLKSAAGEIASRSVILFEVNDTIVAVADLNNDSRVILRSVPTNVRINITVLGHDFKVDKDGWQAPKAVEGATVELFKQITEFLGEEAWAEDSVASVTTDANGEATMFVNGTDLFNHIRVLVGNEEGSSEPVYTNIDLMSAVIVTEAEGYVVPAIQKLTIDQKTESEIDVGFILSPQITAGDYVTRIDGLDRYETSVEVARDSFGTNDVDTVILASGTNFADALVATGLVGALDAPLVLSSPAGLSDDVEEYLKEIVEENGNEVQIIAVGNSVATSRVAADLQALSLKNMQVLGGADRYETSRRVVEYIADELDEPIKAVLVASGENFADALVASVPSALNQQPILLTPRDTFAPESQAILDSLNAKLPSGEKLRVTVVGGPSAISDNTYANINSVNLQRIFGENRQLTSMQAADAYFANGGTAILVDGTNFPDAISAGQLGYVAHAPILLTQSKTSLGDDLRDYILENYMTQIIIVGGPDSVSVGVEGQVRDLLSR